MEDQETLSLLKKRIRNMRRQLHALFQRKKAFTDPEVYYLSKQLDVLITEYQKSIWKRHR